MGLLDRLQPQNQPGNDNGASVSLFHANPQAHNAIASTDQTLLFEGLKARVQDELLEKMDLSKLDEIGYGSVLSEITNVINNLIAADGILITDTDRRSLIEATINDMLGLGPLEPLLHDNEISDILVNGPEAVWVERKGILNRTDISFRDEAHLVSIINRIASRVGRRIDESSPMVDARLPDGSRINAVIRPLAIDGPGLSIRRFGGHHFHIEDFIRNKTLTAEMAEFLHAAVITRLNILVSGGTGSGKTTLLNCLSTYLPSNQRIVTIEDAAELALQQPHVFRLESRPPNVEGGRSHDSRLVSEYIANAPGSRNRRRGSRRGGARHATSYVDRPRRVDGDDSCKQSSRFSGATRDDGTALRNSPARKSDAPVYCRCG